MNPTCFSKVNVLKEKNFQEESVQRRSAIYVSINERSLKETVLKVFTKINALVDIPNGDIDYRLKFVFKAP